MIFFIEILKNIFFCLILERKRYQRENEWCVCFKKKRVECGTGKLKNNVETQKMPQSVFYLIFIFSNRQLGKPQGSRKKNLHSQRTRLLRPQILFLKFITYTLAKIICLHILSFQNILSIFFILILKNCIFQPY